MKEIVVEGGGHKCEDLKKFVGGKGLSAKVEWRLANFFTSNFRECVYNGGMSCSLELRRMKQGWVRN